MSILASSASPLSWMVLSVGRRTPFLPISRAAAAEEGAEPERELERDELEEEWWSFFEEEVDG